MILYIKYSYNLHNFQSINMIHNYYQRHKENANHTKVFLKKKQKKDEKKPEKDIKI